MRDTIKVLNHAKELVSMTTKSCCYEISISTDDSSFNAHIHRDEPCGVIMGLWNLRKC